jgi:hypothetical protein
MWRGMRPVSWGRNLRSGKKPASVRFQGEVWRVLLDGILRMGREKLKDQRIMPSHDHDPGTN